MMVTTADLLLVLMYGFYLIQNKLVNISKISCIDIRKSIITNIQYKLQTNCSIFEAKIQYEPTSYIINNEIGSTDALIESCNKSQNSFVVSHLEQMESRNNANKLRRSKKRFQCSDKTKRFFL